MIGGAAPSHYLLKLQQHKQVLLDDALMNAILESHLIPAETLRADDFSIFYQIRKQRLLALIENVMGKISIAMPLQEEDDEELS
jgi:hypothetical protein